MDGIYSLQRNEFPDLGGVVATSQSAAAKDVIQGGEKSSSIEKSGGNLVDFRSEENVGERLSYPGPKNYCQIGKIRILVAGDSGIGKTTFIEKLFSIPEIIEREPVTAEFGSVGFYRGSTRVSERKIEGESDLDQEVENDFSTCKCRFKFQNSKCDRRNYNITLIDSPGFGVHVNAMDTIHLVMEILLMQYRQTRKFFSDSAGGLERMLMSPNGAHTHVDVCLYGILHRIKEADVEYMKCLSQIVNIVPVILKSDTLSKDELIALKLSVLKTIKKHGINIYTFDKSLDRIMELTQQSQFGYTPFAINSMDSKTNPAHGMSSASVHSCTSCDTSAILFNEFEILKKNLFLEYINDLRYENCIRFIKWRDYIISKSKEVSHQNGDTPCEMNMKASFLLSVPQLETSTTRVSDTETENKSQNDSNNLLTPILKKDIQREVNNKVAVLSPTSGDFGKDRDATKQFNSGKNFLPQLPTPNSSYEILNTSTEKIQSNREIIIGDINSQSRGIGNPVSGGNAFSRKIIATVSRKLKQKKQEARR